LGVLPQDPHKSHLPNISKWQHTDRKQTFDFSEPTGTTGQEQPIVDLPFSMLSQYVFEHWKKVIYSSLSKNVKKGCSRKIVRYS